MGVAKDFCASSIIYIAKTVYSARSIKASLNQVDQELANYKASHKKERCHFGTHLSLDLLGYESTRTYPSGHWSKGADSSFFTKFVEYLVESNFEQNDGLKKDKMLEYILTACRAAGALLRTLFKGSFWLSKHEAEKVIERGYEFARMYILLVRCSLDRQLCLFKIKPKLHMFCHLIHMALVQYRVDASSVVNMLAHSTFQCETFVGHVARMSRRVSAKAHGAKILHRYLVAMEMALASPHAVVAKQHVCKRPFLK